MRPILIDTVIGGWHLVLPAYATFLVLATVIGALVALVVGARSGLRVKSHAAFLALVISGMFVGGRLLHVALNPGIYRADPTKIWSLQATGFALFGGILLALVVGIIAARRLDLSLWEVADATMPGIAVGLVIVRIGCFLNGCCFGHPYDGPTSVLFPRGGSAHLTQLSSGLIGLFDGPLRVHPAQLYEMAGTALSAIVACFGGRNRAPGTAFALFAGLFSAVRWANWELFRVHPATFSGPDWLYPVVYGSVIAIAAMTIAVRARTSDS